MLDGRIVGIWSWERRSASVRHTPSSRARSVPSAAGLRQRLADMQRFLRDDLRPRLA